jgi:hypothetical protein
MINDQVTYMTTKIFIKLRKLSILDDTGLINIRSKDLDLPF